ncbi:MAG TPA: hypothetical protein VN733_07805 [Solirubrobacterales bacterium]|nr:hypothetical protein [Solirubrobacterales bacterium]
MIDGVHIWQAELNGDSWPVLGRVLSHYLDREPGPGELERGERGKPRLREARGLEFNLSHSGGIVLVAVAGRPVGVDVEAIVPKRGRTPGFYEEWVRREARLKCLGLGVLDTPPDDPVAVEGLDLGPGCAAAVAVAGSEVGPLAFRSLEAG